MKLPAEPLPRRSPYKRFLFPAYGLPQAPVEMKQARTQSHQRVPQLGEHDCLRFKPLVSSLSAPFSRNGLRIRFVLVRSPFRNSLNPLQSAARSMEKDMQNTCVARSRAAGMCGDFARNHSDPNRVFLPVTYRGGPKSPFESLDHPAFFHGGTHPGF